jgi:hypothetical protein
MGKFFCFGILNKMKTNKSELYSALVWIFSALVIFVYSGLALLGLELPGVEQLLNFLSNASGWEIYLAAFISIFLEGLYFVGSFFPGSTLVVILAILSQSGGTWSFLTTIFAIFIGWCVAGIVNIFIAKQYRRAVIKRLQEEDFAVKDHIWTTWFPAFRANYEVSQITEGGEPWEVFLSSVRVKLWASGAAALYTVIIPFFIDINEVSNEEGFVSLALIGIITLIVGIIKVRHSHARLTSTNPQS